jgi:hypothetical protein
MPFFSPFRMTLPVAVRATHFTFANFRLDGLPGVTVANHPADLRVLFPANVIEVETTGISFPAVDARMQF